LSQQDKNRSTHAHLVVLRLAAKTGQFGVDATDQPLGRIKFAVRVSYSTVWPIREVVRDPACCWMKEDAVDCTLLTSSSSSL